MDEQRLLAKYRRKQRIEQTLKGASSIVSSALLLSGLLWLLFLPFDQLAQGIRVDEHALQPGQASVKFDWDSVHNSDRYLDKIALWHSQNLSSPQLATNLQHEFSLLGLLSSTQSYTFQTSLGLKSGSNTWAAFVPPRTSGTEAIVVAASWKSLAFKGEFEEGVESYNLPSTEGGQQTKRMRNVRGVATLLGMAEYLRGTNHYAKTIVFIISDDHLEGMQAFLSSYHGTHQPNLMAENLKGLPKGVIWTAICVDYPGHSFSHIGLYFEGTNGRLPNQDLLNSVSHIAQYHTQIPVQLYRVPSDLGSWEDFERDRPWVAWALGEWGFEKSRVYRKTLEGLGEHWFWAGLGRCSGVHGVFLQYRIDAITLFARPSPGPHGFHSLGRLLEASLRTTNNLLERLHASLFFYLYPRPGQSVKVGSYLPAAVLIGSGVSVRGLGLWRKLGMNIGCRPVLKAVAIILGAHVLGVGIFWLGTLTGAFAWLLFIHVDNEATKSPTNFQPALLTTLVILFGLSPIPSITTPSSSHHPTNTILPSTIVSLTHLTIGALIPTLSMLNFPQATLVASLLIPPLFIHPFPSSPSSPLSPPTTMAHIIQIRRNLLAIMFSPVGVAAILGWTLGMESIRRGIWDLVLEWEVLGDWGWVAVWAVWWPVWFAGLLGQARW